MTLRKPFNLSLCLAALAAAAPTMAETLPVEGIYGARTEVPADIEIVAVERFSGDRGFGLQDALTERLGAPIIDDWSFFTLVPATLAPRDRIVVIREGAATGEEATQIDVSSDLPDAVLSGFADARVRDYSTSPKVERECIARDDEGKCTERRRVEIECRELQVSYEAQVTLQTADGAQVYRGGDLLSEAKRYCADEYSTPDPDAMLSGLESQFFARVERDLVPRYRQTTPRLMERRRGLSRGDRRIFKDALKVSDEDVGTACEGFRSLEAGNPQHVSVLFNIGLCLESEGDLDGALDYYGRALEVEPGKDYPTQGERRIRSRLRGEAQLEARGL